MPFYEYKTVGEGCLKCSDVLDISQNMSDEPLIKCPYCNGDVQKLISIPGGIIIGNRSANQYNDCKVAKYWRDKNGVRHKVTSADGHSRALTVTKQTKSPEEVKAIRKVASKVASKKRSKDSYKQFRADVKKKHGI